VTSADLVFFFTLFSTQLSWDSARNRKNKKKKRGLKRKRKRKRKKEKKKPNPPKKVPLPRRNTSL